MHSWDQYHSHAIDVVQRQDYGTVGHLICRIDMTTLTLGNSFTGIRQHGIIYAMS